MRLLVYHNITAGHTQRTPESLIQELQLAGHDVVWLPASDPLPDDVDERFDLVVTAGGDGSVGRAGRQLVGRSLPIATLPLGTANNLGGVLGAGPDDLLERIAAWRTHPFDLGVVEGVKGARYFLEGFGAGAFADAAAALTQLGSVSPPFGVSDELARDLRRLAQAVRTREAMAVDVEVDGSTLSGRYVMVEVLNIAAIGPRVQLALLAEPDDGWLDVALVTDEQRKDLAATLEACEPGLPCLSPLPTRRARRIAFTLPAGTLLHVDGKSLSSDGSAVRVTVHPAALTILRGPDAQRPRSRGPGPGEDFSVRPSAPPASSLPPPRRNPYR